MNVYSKEVFRQVAQLARPQAERQHSERQGGTVLRRGTQHAEIRPQRHVAEIRLNERFSIMHPFYHTNPGNPPGLFLLRYFYFIYTTKNRIIYLCTTNFYSIFAMS